MGNSLCKENNNVNKYNLINIYETLSDTNIKLVYNEKINITYDIKLDNIKDKLIRLIINKNSIFNKWLNKFNYPNNIRKLDIHILNIYIINDQIDFIIIKHNCYNKIEYDVIKNYELNDFIIILVKLENINKYWILLQSNSGTRFNINNMNDPIKKLIKSIQYKLEYTILDDVIDGKDINEICYNRFIKIKSINEYDRYLYVFNLNYEKFNKIFCYIHQDLYDLKYNYILEQLKWSNILNTNDNKLILGINYLLSKFPELCIN